MKGTQDVGSFSACVCQPDKHDIDGVRCAVMGYLASGTHVLSKYDTEQLIEATLRKVVEKVG